MSSSSSVTSSVNADVARGSHALSLYWDDIFEASDVRRVQLRHVPESCSSSRHSFLDDVSSILKDHESPTQECSTIRPDAEVATFLGMSPSHLISYAAKLALNSGKAHRNSRGKLNDARFLKHSCGVNCRRCVHPKLTENNRLEIFKTFWALKDHEKQWEFIGRSIEVNPPKRKSAAFQSKKAKKSSRKFFLLHQGVTKMVCKTMFKNTLCICDSWIDSALSHCSNGSLAIPDRRGHHKKKLLTQNLQVSDLTT